jgi:hypothetical protein
MKNLAIFLLATSVSLNVFADTKTVIRTLNCLGSVTDTQNPPVDIVIKITDYKITYKEGRSFLTDYGTTATVINPQSPKETLAAVTNNDGSEDPQPMRDEKRDGSWAGLSFFDTYKNSNDEGKTNRLGLLILGSKSLPKDKTKRQYEVTINMGELQGPTSKDTKSYVGAVVCDLKKKN